MPEAQFWGESVADLLAAFNAISSALSITTTTVRLCISIELWVVGNGFLHLSFPISNTDHGHLLPRLANCLCVGHLI